MELLVDKPTEARAQTLAESNQLSSARLQDDAIEIHKSGLLTAASKPADCQSESSPSGKWGWGDAAKILGAGATIALDIANTPGHSYGPSVGYGTLGLIQAHKDYHHMMEQTTVAGTAKYAAALAADAVITAGSARILYTRPAWGSYDFALAQTAVYAAMAVRAGMKIAE